jgi:homoserine O-succinyltransferase
MPAISNRRPRSVDSAVTVHPLRLALVNNMPESARAETARDFLSLVTGAPGGAGVEVTHHELTPSDLDRLADQPPDLLIVTGSEPRTARLDEETYWPELVRLLRWAPGATRAVLLSCLTAHAYLLLVDGIERVRLPVKCHGAFRNEAVTGHPLTDGLPRTVRVPHSRANGAPMSAVEAAGWQIHLHSPAAGWSVASRLEENCRVVLAQGHPEYGTETLLREHRRDVRRFLAGERDTYPPAPVDYLGPQGSAAVSAYQAAVGGSAMSAAVAYPFDVAAKSVVNDWQGPARRLVGNWLADAGQRSASSIRS